MIDGGISLITWPVAFTIISGMIVISGSILSLFRKPKSPDALKALHEVELIKVRMSQAETELKNFSIIISNSKETSDRETLHNKDSFVKIDKKLEKISDLMIELIRTRTD